MKKVDLQALIDRAIGQNGIARVPAWWLKKLFKSTADYADAADAEIGATKRSVIEKKTLESSTQSLVSGCQYEGKVPFSTVDLYISSAGFREAYARFILSESDDVSYAIQGDDSVGGIIWANKPDAKKNTEYAVTVLGNMAWAAARPLNHIHIKYNITDISAPTKMFNKTGSVALFLLDGVPGKMSEEHQFETTGIHTVDIYDTSISLSKVLNGIPEIVDVKLYTYTTIGTDFESMFEGTSIRSANWTEARGKNQTFIYGQMLENCINLDERYLNADLRNMALIAKDRMYAMFYGTTLETIDLSTWKLKDASGLSADEGIFPTTLKRLIVGKPEDLAGDVRLHIPAECVVIIASERDPYAVFYNPNGTMYKEMTTEELTELPEVPALEGYTSVGWNLTLDEIQSRLSLYGHCEVGAVYSTPTSVAKVTIPEDKLVGGLGLIGQTEDFVGTVNWGDGSEPESVTAAVGSAVELRHQYAEAGVYEIRITRSSGYYSPSRTSFYAYADTTTTENYTTVAMSFSIVGDGLVSVNSVDKTPFPVVGRHFAAAGKYFYDKLSYISIPDGIANLTYNPMTGTEDYDLLNIVLPESITLIADNYFRRAKYLQGIVFPTGLTTIGANAFESCFSMRKVVFPPALTSIGERAFADCFRCSIYDFSKVNQIPEIATDAFPPLTEDYEILVSAGMYDEFSRKYRMAHWASRIYKA